MWERTSCSLYTKETSLIQVSNSLKRVLYFIADKKKT